MQRNHSIDAIRFICALTVVLAHTYKPVFLLPFHDIYSSVLFGRSAVIVFFVVSGLCIHGPHIDAPVDWRAYFVRRFVRILLPVCLIVPIANVAGVSYYPYVGWVTWTLVCELIYYTLYPALRPLAARFGWLRVIAASYVIGYATVALTGTDDSTVPIQIARDTLSCMPAWLLGCWVAEIASRRAFPNFNLYAARTAVVLCSIGCAVLHNSGVLNMTWTSPAFALIVAPWLALELKYDTLPRLWGSWGEWSYSLYLVHPAAFGWFVLLATALPQGTRWPFQVAFVLGSAYVFFLAVELPSHRLARLLASKVKTKSSAALP